MKRAAAPMAAAVAAALTVLGVGVGAQPSRMPAGDNAMGHVGSAACAGCHADQSAAWQVSHHARAMADISTAKADFSGHVGTGDNGTALARGPDGPEVAIRDADGTLRHHRLSHVLGVEPLQQYLVPRENGALQVFGWSWDTRAKEDGGQRWFQIYDEDRTRPGQPLHWSGRDQTFNFMCADCHVTGYRKAYDPVARRYHSTWSEMGVGCEGCHGPGRDHLAWAARSIADRATDPRRGLAWLPRDRAEARWVRPPGAPTAMRDPPRARPAGEQEVCGRCHSHRSQFGDALSPGMPLMDAYLPSLLADDLFWPDGAMRSEVYNLGSFLQSRMHGQGVTCSDCHEPHAGRLRAEGNRLCATCHAPEHFETRAHHQHDVGGVGGRCVSCHMPATTYMGVDRRHDHAFSIPRPHLAARIGRPDACTACHVEKPPGWTQEAAERLFPTLSARPAPFAQAMLAHREGLPDAAEKLRAVVRDGALPAIQRSSALQRLAARGDRLTTTLAAALAGETDALLRHAAAEALAGAMPADRVRWLSPLLADPVGAVRIAAARGLAALSDTVLPPPLRPALARALEEYRAAQRYNADHPHAWVNLATLDLDRNDRAAARRAIDTALILEPDNEAARLTSADLNRVLGRETEVEQELRAVLALAPDNPLALHMLGLSLVRQKRLPEALAPLRDAADRAPGSARFVFVLIVALDNAGRTPEAEARLGHALRRHAGNEDLERLAETFRRRVPR